MGAGMRRLRWAALLLLVVAANTPQGLAQQPATIFRIGFLGPSAPPPATSQLDVFRRELAKLGYQEGRDVIIDSRWPEANRLDQLPAAAAALIATRPNVLFAVGATAARVAKEATNDRPIVFAGVVDPVAAGLVASRARPGGNLTGATTFDSGQARRQLEILRQALPGLKRVALLGDSGTAQSSFQVNEDAARELGLEALVVKVERGAANPDFDGAFAKAKQEGAGAVVVLSTPVTTPSRRRIAEAAIRHRIATLSPREHADSGALLSFGTGFSEATRAAAAHVDKILKGAKAGELPIETITRHELVVNLKTAREVGLTLPSDVLSNAHEVIE
jgi:putative ABC transport system substrate-binding protein